MLQLLVLAAALLSAVVAEEEFKAFEPELTAATGEAVATGSSSFLAPVNSFVSPELWNSMTIKERILAYDWQKERLIFLSIAGYVVLHYIGVRVNRSKVSDWIKGHRSVLSRQFHQVGVSKEVTSATDDMALTVADSSTAYTTYATGRENVRNVRVQFRLLGRQNFITLSMEYFSAMFFQGFYPRDEIDVVITPTDDKTIEPFVFGLVNKDEMRRAREQKYYLSLTKTVDSDHIPDYLVFMSESAEVNDAMLACKELFSVIPDAEDILDFIAITDLPDVQPSSLADLDPHPRVVLSLKFPRNEKATETSAKLIDAAINLVDLLASKKAWRPEVSKKIRATREAETKKIQKALDSQKAEDLAAKKAEAKREAKSAQGKLSPEEQRKVDQKEREKEARRQRKNQIKRG